MAINKLAKITIAITVTLMLQLFLSGNNASAINLASCRKGGNYIKVYSEATLNGNKVYEKIGDIGNGNRLNNTSGYQKYSGGWACTHPDNRSYAILFFAKGVRKESWAEKNLAALVKIGGRSAGGIDVKDFNLEELQRIYSDHYAGLENEKITSAAQSLVKTVQDERLKGGNDYKKIYTIETDVEINLNSTNNKAYVMGIVNGNASVNYATYVSYCIKKADCSKRGSKTVTNAKGIIAEGFARNVKRRGKNDPQGSGYAGWNAPLNKTEIIIDGTKVKEHWNELKKIQLDNGRVMIVLYLYRCYGYGENRVDGTCGKSPIYLLYNDTTPGTPSATCDNTNSQRNSGQSGVRKNNGDFVFASNDNSASIWAKPGDSIQFTHQTCASAQKYIDDNPAYLSGDAAYSVTASSNYGNGNDGYLFGDDLAAGISANISTNKIRSNNYAYTVFSPSFGAGNNYSCAKIGSAFSGHYQIPSLTSDDNCYSARTTRLSDVGNKITQTMNWTDFRFATCSRKIPAVKDDEGNIITPSYYEYYPCHAGTSELNSSASVQIPYNYILKPYIKNKNNSAVIVLGDQLDANVYVPVDVRENRQVGATYATHTKPTKIKVVSFIMGSASQPNGTVTYRAGGSDVGAGAICNYAIQDGNASYCDEVKTIDGKVLNENSTGSLDGTYYSSDFEKHSTDYGGTFLTTVHPAVPSVSDGSGYNIGDRFCITVAAWPSDSHNLGDAASVNSSNQDIALSASAGTNATWAISAPTCVTLAKRPIFSVEASQLLTAGNVTSSTYGRSGLTYSSWSEYGIIAGGKVTNMASGAATAYIDALGLNTAWETNYAIGSKDVNIPDENSGTSAGIAVFDSQTMLNVGPTKGYATSLNVGERISEFYEAIKSNYTRKNSTKNYHKYAGIDKINNIYQVQDLYTNSWRSITMTTRAGETYYDLSPRNAYACDYSEELGYYVPNPDDAKRAKKKNGTKIEYTAPFYCLPNGAEYYYVEGNGYIGSQYDDVSGQYLNFVDDLADANGYKDTYRNQTTVIHVTGKLVIDVNLIIDSWYAVNYGWRTDFHLVDRFTDIQQIPQLIIIAHDIDITANVSRIDAWLITDIGDADKNFATGGGSINTCAYDNFSGFIYGQYITGPGVNNFDAKRCNRELIFNNPVIANKIILNRTAGAGTEVYGTSPDVFRPKFKTPYRTKTGLEVEDRFYSQRGEIFNLRADSYYWSYYQAQRNGILTTVFTKELPTRY